jgi:prophage regulatory protein
MDHITPSPAISDHNLKECLTLICESADRKLRSQEKADRKIAVRLSNVTFHSIVGFPEVIALTNLSRAQIYRKMRDGTFPSNRKLSKQRAGWRMLEILEWLANPC